MSKNKTCLTLLTTVINLIPFFAFAQTPLKVCPNPAAPCINKHGGRFAEYELSFRLPAKFRPNTLYKSEPFYAVILKDKIKVTEKEECDGGEYHKRIENERKQIQKSFTDRKVFASYQCPDMAAIEYEVNSQPHNENFIAVYGGATLEEANIILEQVKTKYPKAVVRKMRAVFENMEQ